MPRRGRIAGTQNSEVEVACVDCGSRFTTRSRSKLRCDACRETHRRTYAREQHRRTIPDLRCVDCGATLEPRLGVNGGGARPKRCEVHAAEHNRRMRTRKEELRRYRRHGLDEPTYLAMLEAQAGGCAICGTDTPDAAGRSWHIDHDHECCPGPYSCGACVRGLLCGACNQGVGYFRDDVALMRRAIDYLSNGTQTARRR